jgi:hypothetical protein
MNFNTWTMFHRDSEVKVLKSVQLVLTVSYFIYQRSHAFVISFKLDVVSFTILSEVFSFLYFGLQYDILFLP